MATPAKIVDFDIPTVALVGRVNVGKSSLFNKITETSHAIISAIPGTTRTRNIGLATWRGKNFRLVDTGGLTFDQDVPLENEIIKQTELAIAEADVIVMVVDVKNGALPQERELAKKILRKIKKPVIFVANKADNPGARVLVYDQEWQSFGMGVPLAVSAKNGSGVGDLLDVFYKKFREIHKTPKTVKPVNPIRVAILGKPNVGKSSLFNSLIGEDRVVVNKLPHTTREPHDILVETEGQHIIFIDTAGIRRKTKVSGELEKIGIGKSLEMINRSDVVLLVLDASEPISDQDQQLAGLLRAHARSVIIVINKWDLSEDNTDKFRNEIKEKIYANFPHLNYAPIVFTSAKTHYRTHQIFPMILRAALERKTEIPDDLLQEFLKKTVRQHLPARGRGVRHPEILGLTQIGSNPPVFDLRIKNKTSVSLSYVHFIANRLRENFGFFATPVSIKLSKMKKDAPRRA